MGIDVDSSCMVGYVIQGHELRADVLAVLNRAKVTPINTDETNLISHLENTMIPFLQEQKDALQPRRLFCALMDDSEDVDKPSSTVNDFTFLFYYRSIVQTSQPYCERSMWLHNDLAIHLKDLQAALPQVRALLANPQQPLEIQLVNHLRFW